MKIPYLCLLIVTVLPIVLASLSKALAKRSGLVYDNRTPRALLTQMGGAAQRADWAQQNAWEALPMFAAAVLMAMQAQVPMETVSLWSLIFVLARLAHGALYIADLATLRSLAWILGLASVVRLMVAAI